MLRLKDSLNGKSLTKNLRLPRLQLGSRLHRISLHFGSESHACVDAPMLAKSVQRQLQCDCRTTRDVMRFMSSFIGARATAPVTVVNPISLRFDGFPLGLPVKAPNFKQSLLIPLVHVNDGLWSLVVLSRQRKKLVLSHYDPVPSQASHAKVVSAIAAWASRVLPKMEIEADEESTLPAALASGFVVLSMMQDICNNLPVAPYVHLESLKFQLFASLIQAKVYIAQAPAKYYPASMRQVISLLQL
ncbi:hypothetical protein CTRI78_v011070 [Colletotrichum trifolii]|uniref:Ubiquitin-like protease family profile domain-containing protein n=1 Tax=Colletotrichum trifolii TaxID=5466 RepID=A0A4V3HSZ6_COLTR|nr:hypothetical protein CTRI78_v011070 [Colletotrichum trifolii]